MSDDRSNKCCGAVCAEDTPLDETAETVSYTQLYVYKRQACADSVYIIVTLCGSRFNDLGVSAVAAYGLLLAVLGARVRVPVSYTHLDVYKRQDMEVARCVFTFRGASIKHEPEQNAGEQNAEYHQACR